MTLAEQRTRAISGRAWKSYDGPTRAQPRPAENDPGQERLRRDLEDLRATNAKLGDALRKLKAENDRLRLISRTVLESTLGEDWREQLMELQRSDTPCD